jgi:hypothetical protein
VIFATEGDGVLRPVEGGGRSLLRGEDLVSLSLALAVGHVHGRPPKTRKTVNTKNWYRKETDLWAEFGKRAPFGRRFSSKHSVKMPAVGSTPTFGRRAVSRLEERAFGNT